MRDDVKHFGQMMVKDHTAINDDLKALAAQKGVALPDGLDTKHQAMVDKLTALTGSEFDDAYIKGMIRAHQNDNANNKQLIKTMKTKIAVVTILCSLTMWTVAQTGGAGGMGGGSSAGNGSHSAGAGNTGNAAGNAPANAAGNPPINAAGNAPGGSVNNNPPNNGGINNNPGNEMPNNGINNNPGNEIPNNGNGMNTNGNFNAGQGSITNN